MQIRIGLSDMSRAGVRRLLAVLAAGVPVSLTAAAIIAAVSSAASDRAAPRQRAQGFASCRSRSATRVRRCIQRMAASSANQVTVRARAASAASGLGTPPYATDVNPGRAIQFVSDTTGWRLDDVYAAPWLAGELSSRPGGTTIDWPAGAVSKSTDGGTSWQIVRSDHDGIWGIDFLSTDVGWVVGVNSLSATQDGGATWQTLGEPSDSSLVTVEFVSPNAGFGITAANQLVRTDDGGASWQMASLNGAATALCFSSATTGYVADDRGDVFRTSDGGVSWANDYRSTIPSAYPQVWSQLACDASSAWQGIRVISPQLPQEAFLVEQRGVGSSSWRAVVSNAAGGPDLAPSAPGPDGFEALTGVASHQGKGLLAGVRLRGFNAALASASGASAVASAPVERSLPASTVLEGQPVDPFNYIRVLGVTSLGSEAWVYLVDSAVHGMSPDYDTLVLSTTNGGTSWVIANDSGTRSQPQYP